MPDDALRQLEDVSVGDWIAPRLGPFAGGVGSVVPHGFEAYARVLHPVRDTQQQPDEGNLDAASLAVLCRVLGAYTAVDTTCYFALWDGYGWLHGSPAVGILESTSCRRTPPIPPADVTHARLRHPDRDYILFGGPLMSAGAIPAQLGIDAEQSPNLFWPADRSWCVATEVDLDSTLVAGGMSLVAALVDEPALEVWRVGPDDPL